MFIYKLTSPSGKSYIGQTSQQSVEKRFSQHITAYRKWIKNDRPRKAYQTKLFYAFDAHDPSKWNVSILCETFDQKQLDKLEIDYIKLFNTNINGYNLQQGGAGWKNFKLSEEHKENQSKSRLEWLQTPEGIAYKALQSRRFTGNNPSKKGRKSWNKGKKCPQISEGQKNGKKYEYTEEDRKRQSEKSKQLWKEGTFANRPKPTPEQNMATSARLKGHPAYPNQQKATKETMSCTFLLKKISGEEITINNLIEFSSENKIPIDTLRYLVSKQKSSIKHNIKSIERISERYSRDKPN